MTPKLKTIPFGEHRFIKDATVVAGSGLIYKNQTIYHFGDFDPSTELLAEEIASFYKQHPRSMEHSNIDAPIYPLNLMHSGNYFHLLVEHLPRFIKLKQDGILERDVIIVLGQQHKNLLDAFFLANNDENRLTLLKHGNSLSSPKIIGSSGSFQQFELKDKTMPSKASVCSESLAFARHYYWKKLGLDSRKKKSGAGKKLFVLRHSKHRNLLNINELASIAQEHNFELLRPELLTFREQAQVFSEAEIVIGPTGAWLANLFFLRPEAIVHILYPVTCKTETSPWKRIGDIFGISVNDYYSKTIALNEFQPIHSSFAFNAEEFDKILKQ